MLASRETTLAAVMWLVVLIGCFVTIVFADSINPFTPDSLPGRYFFWLLVACSVVSVAVMCWLTHYYRQRVLYKVAMRFVKNCEVINTLIPEIVPARDTDFEMLNRAYYTRVTREFVAEGFREFGDFRDESVHLLTKGIYGVSRLFLDDSGEILAACIHFVQRRKTSSGEVGLHLTGEPIQNDSETYSIGLTSQVGETSLLVSTCSNATGTIVFAPSIDSIDHGLEYPLSTLVAEHRQRLRERDAAPFRFSSAADYPRLIAIGYSEARRYREQCGIDWYREAFDKLEEPKRGAKIIPAIEKILASRVSA